MSNLTHAPRSQIFGALFDLIQTIPCPVGSRWKTASQKLVQWDKVPPVNQPAIYLYRGPQKAESNKVFGVTKWQLRATLWIYFRTDGLQTSNTYPDQITDPLLDAIEEVFQPSPQVQRNTLGGLVYHCWIDGVIVFDSGISDGQAVCIVPLSLAL